MKKKKKNKQIIDIPPAYIAAGVLLVAIMTFFGISSFLRVNVFAVEGMNIYSAEQIVEASKVSRGDNLLYLNKNEITRNITAELSYISSVELKRDLPGTLLISVKESAPLAFIPFAGDALVIDSSGRVLDIVKMTGGNRVEIGGVSIAEVRGVPINEAELGSAPKVGQGSEASFLAMQDILIAMEREGVAVNVNYLDVANITNISFGYADLYRVVIGGLRDYRHKISGLPSIVTQIQESYGNTRGVVNMTNPSGVYSFVPDQ